MTRAGKGEQRWAGGETWIRGTDAFRQQCTVSPVILWFIGLNGRHLIADDNETSTPDSLAARGFSSPGQPLLNARCLTGLIAFHLQSLTQGDSAQRWAHSVLRGVVFKSAGITSFQKSRCVWVGVCNVCYLVQAQGVSVGFGSVCCTKITSLNTNVTELSVHRAKQRNHCKAAPVRMRLSEEENRADQAFIATSLKHANRILMLCRFGVSNLARTSWAVSRAVTFYLKFKLPFKCEKKTY